MEQILLQVGVVEAVHNGGTPVQFTLDRKYKITLLYTYHWNNGQGAPGGTITISKPCGSVVASFHTKGLPHAVRPQTPPHCGCPHEPAPPGNRPLYWMVCEDFVLPAGSYRLDDSDHSTWATSPQTHGAGHCLMKGIPMCCCSPGCCNCP